MHICLFMLFLVGDSSIEWANWFLAGVAAVTGFVIWRQVKIAKDTLIAMQRPRLTVKHLFLTPPADITKLGDSREWKVGCVVANIGGSKARVVESNLTIRFLGIGTVQELLRGVPHYENKYSFGTFIMQPGERRSVETTLDNTDGNKIRFHVAMARKVNTDGQIPFDTNPTVCYGYFKYRDDSGIERLSGFGCRLNRFDLSLTRLNIPDYEYED